MRLLVDACVLYPTVPRALVLGLGQAGWADLVWSDRILEEWRRAVLRNVPDQAALARMEIDAARVPSWRTMLVCGA